MEWAGAGWGRRGGEALRARTRRDGGFGRPRKGPRTLKRARAARGRASAQRVGCEHGIGRRTDGGAHSGCADRGGEAATAIGRSAQPARDGRPLWVRGGAQARRPHVQHLPAAARALREGVRDELERGPSPSGLGGPGRQAAGLERHDRVQAARGVGARGLDHDHVLRKVAARQVRGLGRPGQCLLRLRHLPPQPRHLRAHRRAHRTRRLPLLLQVPGPGPHPHRLGRLELCHLGPRATICELHLPRPRRRRHEVRAALGRGRGRGRLCAVWCGATGGECEVHSIVFAVWPLRRRTSTFS